MKRKKRLGACPVYALVIVTSIFFLHMTTGPVSAQTNLQYPKVLRFAAPSPGSMLYAVNSGLAKVASDHSPMTVLIVPTTGSSAWYPMLSKLGSADLAVDNLTVFWQMWHGQAAPEPLPKGFPPKPPMRRAERSVSSWPVSSPRSAC